MSGCVCFFSVIERKYWGVGRGTHLLRDNTLLVDMVINSASPFASIVIYDSLLFWEKPANSGIFVFGDSSLFTAVDSQYFVFGCNRMVHKCSGWSDWFATHSYNFMPLKRRGFKNDMSSKRYPPLNFNLPGGCVQADENFGFTMEMHRKFMYKPGQTFTFKGDDDVWVFINNRLVIDLGGIHLETVRSVNLDTLGLTAGEQYWFDLFYCERWTIESNLYITTNMLLFTMPPQSNKRNWKRDYGNLD